MPLPILNVQAADLVRAVARAELHWAGHVAEQTQLDVGVAFTNPAFPNVFAANRIRDAVLPEGMTPRAAVEQVNAHFGETGTRCLCWSLDETSAAHRTQPLREYLLSIGAVADSFHAMAFRQVAPGPPPPPEVAILPARAALRHLPALAALEPSRERTVEQIVELKSLHLDDPHTDAIIAIQGGLPIGYAAVLAAGEVGMVKNVFVAESHRRRGVGRYLMQRILEICARSQFRHVLLKVRPHAAAAQNLYRSIGFEKIAEGTDYRTAAAAACS
jgi:ribosomal protein S18 acetylase RimI-like enzyme